MNLKTYFLPLVLVTFASLAALARAESPYSSVGHNSAAGLRPARDLRGRYPLLLNSMHKGEVPSINPHNVTRYGSAYIGAYNNRLYWMVPVEYGKLVPPARDFYSRGYGMVMTEAIACVRNGRVEHWIYKKSRTPVR